MFQFNNSTTTYDFELSTLTKCEDLKLSQGNISCVNISKEYMYHRISEYNDDTIGLLKRIFDRFAVSVCSLGLILNILNIIAIVNSPCKLTPHSKLVTSLAVSDLCFALQTICSMLISELRKYYDVGLCYDTVLQRLFIPGVILASLFNLLALGIDHFIAIVKPLHYSRIVTNSRTSASIALIWIVSFITVVIEPIYEINNYFEIIKYYDGHQDLFCIFMFHNYMSRIPDFLVIPEFIVLVLLYTRIYVAYKQYVMRRTTFRPDDQHNNKAIVTTLLIIATFMVGWVPYSLTIIVYTCGISGMTWDIAQHISLCFAYLNPLCDALIYALRLEIVKQGYKTIFRKVCRKCQICFRKENPNTDAMGLTVA